MPACKVLLENVAVPFDKVPEPIAVEPFRKVTVPEGGAPPGPGCNTVAVKITFVPASTVEEGEITMPVKVDALVIVAAAEPFENP